MNKIRATLYIVLTFGMLVALNHYVATSSMYKNKMEKIDDNYKKLERFEVNKFHGDDALLVIGNSYVASSFNPELSSGNTVLFTVAGMPMVDILGIVEHLPKHIKINSIIVGLGYNYANPVSATSNSYGQYFTDSSVRKIWSSLPLVRGRSITSSILKEDIKCMLSSITSAKCKKNLDDELNARTTQTGDEVLTDEAHKKRIRKNVAQRYREYQPFIAHVSDVFTNHLRRMQIACKKRNIKLYAYTAPIYSELFDKITPSFLDRFRSSISETGINYVDLNLVFPNMDAKMFTDATHLSKKQAREQATSYLKAFSRQGPVKK